MRTLLPTAAFLLLLSPAAAAQTQTQTLTLPDAIALAKRHAFASRISGFREAAARDVVAAARLGYLPDFSANVASDAREFDVNQRFVAVNEVNDYDRSTDANVRASYVLLSTTRRLDVAAAKARLTSESADNETAKRAVIRDTARAYLQVVQSDALLRLAEQDLSRRTRHLEESRALVKAGKRADFEVIRAEAELASAEASLIEARNNVRLARSTLSQVCGKELGIEFAVESPAPPVDPRRENQPLADVVSAALPRRSDIRSAEADASAARLAWNRSSRQLLPTVSLYANYNRTLDRITEYDPYEANLSYGAQLEIRFSDTLRNAYRSRAARAEARLAAVVADQTRVAVSLEIERAALEANRAAEVLAAMRKSVDASRRNYESAAERYRLGVATQTERIDAESTLVQAEVDHARADVAHRTALWNLRYEMGEPLE